MLLALGIGVLAAVISAIYFTFSQDRQKQIIGLDAIADLKSSQIEIWFREREGDAEYVGSSPYLRELATKWRDQKDRIARDRIFQRLEQTRSAYGYEDVYFYDGIQQKLQGSQKQADVNRELHGIIRDAITSNAIRHIGPYVDNGQVVLDFVSPLGSGSQATGAAIILRIDPKKVLFPLLNFWPYPSGTGESILIRRDGKQVAYLSELRFQPDAAGRFRVPFKDRGVLAVRALGNEALLGHIVEGVDYRHSPAIGVTRPIKGSDWFLLTKLDLAEVTAGGYRSATWIALLGLLSLLFIIGVTVALRQRQLLLDTLLEQAAKDERIRSLELLDAISASSADAIFAKDLDGRYMMCNGEAARLMGKTPAEIVGRDDMAIFPHETAIQFVANDQSVIAESAPRTFLETLEIGSEKIILQSTKGPLRDRLGAVIGVFGLARNVTGEKESELRLRESEERFRRLFEDTRQPIMLIEDGRFSAANAAALALLKVTDVDDFVGKTPQDISPPVQSDGRPSEEKSRELIAKALEQGSNEFEWEHIRANGEHFIARVLLTPIRQGGKDLLHVVWNDITAQKEAEKQIVDYQKDLERRVADRTAELTAMTATLRQANEERQAVFDAATVGVNLTRDGRIVRCNRTMELLFGYEHGELNGQSTRILCPDGETHREIMEHLLGSLRSSGSYRDERQLMRKDGSLFWCREMAQALDRNNLESGFASTFEDISVERAALDEIQRARTLAEDVAAAKANFLANMSHEIRTPMNAIIGMTYLALKANRDRQVQDFLQKIKLSSEHLLGIINDILDFSKIEAGKMPIEKVDFELETVLDNAAALIAEKSASKNLEVIIDVAPDVPNHLLGDPLRVQQILVNYLNNAVKFTEAGEIVLSVAASTLGAEATLRFSVRDSGIGISKEQQDRLFQSFHQVDPSTTRKFGGTGLGLTIVKRLAEAMGGGVGVDSALGEGSTFWFTAPFGLGREPTRTTVTEPRLRGRRVLVVDDHPEARQVFEGMLRSMGFLTTSSGSGSEGLRELHAASEAGTPYEIVLLDWKMPDMNGVAVAGEIQKMDLERPPVVLMVTAYDRNELLRAAADVRVDDVLCKPFTSSTLLDSISRVLGASTLSRKPPARIDDVDIAAAAEGLRDVRVLLVEDNELNQEVATGLLEELGVRVDVASNGAQAIEMAESGGYDIILMDIQMPVMDGVSATRALRRQPRFYDTPILAMTASVLHDDQKRFLAAGMNDHIGKPIDPSELAGALLVWAPKRRAGTIAGPPAEGPATKAPTTAAVLPEAIEGLDTGAGLHRVLGNAALYLSLLRKFVAGQSEVPAAIGERIDARDMEGAERLAHTMKGVAGNIGAVGVQDAAADLELALHERLPRQALAPRLEAHRNAVSKLVNSLRRALPPETVEVAPHDVKTLDLFCDRLRLFLEESDAQASYLLAENAELLRYAFPKQFPALKTAIEAFDYETALDVLDAARARKTATDEAAATP